MSGFDTPTIDERMLLMWSHITVVAGIGIGLVYRQYFFALQLLASAVISISAHDCQESPQYGLEGSAWCLGVQYDTWIYLDRLFACQAVQGTFLTGPDWSGTEGRICWYLISLVGNALMCSAYGTETWALVLYGAVVFVVIQTYRILMLLYYNKLYYFWQNHFNVPAGVVTLILAGGAIALFYNDPGQYYWIIHSMWHVVVYLDSMFAFWIMLGNVPLWCACASRKKGVLFWPGNFWALQSGECTFIREMGRLGG